jgi:hypothetical protein
VEAKDHHRWAIEPLPSLRHAISRSATCGPAASAYDVPSRGRLRVAAPKNSLDEENWGMLSASWDSIRLFVHVLAATIWVGGQITLAAPSPAGPG